MFIILIFTIVVLYIICDILYLFTFNLIYQLMKYMKYMRIYIIYIIRQYIPIDGNIFYIYIYIYIYMIIIHYIHSFTIT